MDLEKIILKEWDAFKMFFGNDKSKFQALMENINRLCADAHAKNMTDDEMMAFRVSMGILENFLKKYDGVSY